MEILLVFILILPGVGFMLKLCNASARVMFMVDGGVSRWFMRVGREVNERDMEMKWDGGIDGNMAVSVVMSEEDRIMEGCGKKKYKLIWRCFKLDKLV